MWTEPLSFLWSIVTSVFFINLLIAKVTTTYEEIQRESAVHRIFQHVSLIIVYKDGHGAVPPPFNLLLVPMHYCFKLVTNFCCPNSRWAAENKPLPGYIFHISQGRKHELDAVTHTTLSRCLENDLARVQGTLDARVEAIHAMVPVLQSVQTELADLNERVARLSRIRRRVKHQQHSAEGHPEPHMSSQHGAGSPQSASSTPCQLVQDSFVFQTPYVADV